MNLLNKRDFQAVNKKVSPITLQQATIKLFPYNSKQPIPVLGKFQAPVEFKHSNVKSICFYVVESYTSTSLIGLDTALELGLLKVNDSVVEVNQYVNTLPIQPELKAQPEPKGQPSGSPKNDQLVADAFQGIGKLKDFQLDLHINKDVKPVAQAARRIPFHLRSKVEAELENLPSHGIIEKVSGPTPWVSPIVVAPKPHDKEKIRICVDTRDVNTAIEREHHPMPTLDELTHDLSGACVFSKLDLRSAYHQIELAPSSRYVTVFATHKGLFQYRRLFFGIKSASEIFGHTLQPELNGIEGVKSIADDIFIFGKDQTS